MKKAKQVLIIRKDLKMRRGKEIAQGSHASLGAILNLMNDDDSGSKKSKILHYKNDDPLDAWINGPFTKICLYVNSEEELLELDYKAKEAKLIHCLITDAGRTEFHGIPTKTVLAIGPAWEEDINKITGHLPLY